MEMNGPPSQSASASAAASTASTASAAPATAATTPQQVAAAAAALAASRAASVSAAMRSVFGAKQQAALASAMMNASVNAAASKAAAAAVARAVPTPPAPALKPTVAMATATSTATATPTATAAPTAARMAATNTHVAATTSVLVMLSSYDGLPALAPHAASCTVEDAATTARIASLACAAHDVPHDGTVELFGEPTTRAAVRAALVDHYAATNQLLSSTTAATTSSTPSSTVSEMTLRMDTELEMLRRQCFAERNARWHYYTPDQFAPALPVVEHAAAWTGAPYVGPRRQTLLLRKYHEHQRLHGGDKSVSSDPLLADHEALLRSLVGVERVRDRAWPPREFVAKANTKPSRGGAGAGALHNAANRTSSGKKKPVGMVGVVDETPVTARVCAECLTQSSALWRKRPRATAPASAATPVPETSTPTPVATLAVEEEDVCLPCFLKTQRRELFVRKAAEKARRVKEEAARAAAEARALKKQQQQMQKKIKKLQHQQSHQEDHDADAAIMVDVEAEDARDVVKQEVEEDEDEDANIVIRPIKLSRRESMTAATATAASSALHGYEAAAIGSADYESLAASGDDRKKRDKKSKKDKKKKKKKKKKKVSSDGWDDSDSDDDGAASSVVMPSPPHRQMDGFVYADRAADGPLANGAFNHEEDARSTGADSNAPGEPVVDVVVKSESRSKKRGAATSTATASRASSSKKRKSTDSLADAPVAVPPTPTEKGRGSRARSSSTASAAPVSAAAATAAAAAAVAPTTPSARKRARPTKKESARERELRALGQYCPVCNMTYEEDDASPFVCCDSCEMWVHAACDTSLSPEALAALAESSDKYICPLCGGR